jgi:hypothetical protein
MDDIYRRWQCVTGDEYHRRRTGVAQIFEDAMTATEALLECSQLPKVHAKERLSDSFRLP